MAVQSEYEGKNVEDAIKAASATLKIAPEKLNYKVLDYGKSGFLGFGVKKARIKVDIKAEESEQGVSSLVDEAFGGFQLKDKKLKKTFSKKPEKVSKPVVRSAAKPESVVQAEKLSVVKEKKAPIEEPVKQIVPVSDEAVEIGRQALEHILPALSDSFEIAPVVMGNEVLYNLKAENPGVIIGKKGQNLEAIQFLVDKIVNKQSGGEDRVRVLIDIEDYLERRKQNLHAMALRFSAKVKKTGKPATIGQLSAYERRFIHIALRDDKSVRTQSMGEGYYRKLVVFPTRRSRGRRKPVKKD